MTMKPNAGPSMDGSAADKLRPIAHGQFKLLPVPIRHDREWNSRVVEWAVA